MGEKIKQINAFFRYSGVWIGFVFNPVHWVFDMNFTMLREEDSLFTFELYLGVAWIRIIIDNGEW